MNTITTNQIFKANNVLTLEVAKSLIGKKIACTNREYSANSSLVDIFTVSEIISEWEKGARMPYTSDKFKTFQDYWASYMQDWQIEHAKTNLLLLCEKGEKHGVCATKFLSYFDEPTFYGSDADREIYYIEVSK